MSIVMLLATTGCGNKEEESNELTVFAMNQDTELENFLTSYRGVDGDMTVNVEVGLTDPSMKVGDILNKLNTKLMGDEGPDIIVLDGINPEGYIESGQLEKLNKIVKENDNLIGSISDDKNEDIYFVPLSVALIGDFYTPDSEIDFSNTGTYVNSLQSQGKKSGSYINNAVISYKLDMEPRLLKADKITEEELKAFIENTKALLSVSQSMQGILRSGITPLNYTPISTSDYFEIYFGKAAATRGYISGVGDLQEIYNLKSEGMLDFNLAEVNGEKLYMPNCILAVNANSKNKKKAMEMVEYLLSKEGQNDVASKGNYIPVNKVALKEALENQPELNSSISVVGDSKAFVFKPFNNDEIQEIMSLIDDLKYECSTDTFLMEIILMAAQDYANEEATMDTVVESAMSKIRIYMAE